MSKITYKQMGFNIFDIIKDFIPEDLFYYNRPLYLKSVDTYFKSKYGNRHISIFLENVIESYGVYNDNKYTLTSEGYDILKYMIVNKYRNKWNKLIKLCNKDYDPLKPFDIKLNEKSTDTLNSTNTNTKNITHTFTNTEDIDRTDTNVLDYEEIEDKKRNDRLDRSSTNTDDNTDKIYGYDSSSPTNSTSYEKKLTEKGLEINTYNEDNTINRDSTDTNTIDSIINRSGTDTDSGTVSDRYNRDKSNTREYTRTGNIGNTSFQELIVQERNILEYQIIDTFFRDIATVVCRGKYL